ncbi:hypothetical protein EON65_40230 [archaeon]|nr:MAG: hypothetical protein EON65_40230 [archaeon]
MTIVELDGEVFSTPTDHVLTLMQQQRYGSIPIWRYYLCMPPARLSRACMSSQDLDACQVILISFHRMLGMGDDAAEGFMQKCFEMAARPLDALVIQHFSASSFPDVHLAFSLLFSAAHTALDI